MRRSTLTALIALALLTPAGVVAADPGTTPDFPVPMPHNDVELQDVLAQLPGIIEGLAQNRTDMAHCPEAAGGTVGTPENRNQPGRGPTEDDHGNPLTRHDRGQGPASLPDQVLFRSTHESYNRRYQFALRHGDVFYKSNTAGTGIHEPWARLALPSCLVGRVAGLSVDDDELVVVDADRWIFTMDGATLDPTAFNWSMRWGRPFWTGAGRTLPHHVRDWEWSVLSQVEDGTWQDTAGNRHQVGDGKVSHIWMLRGDGHRLTFIDPWLPPDQSYEMCGPHRGRFRSAALSVSGSTVFVIGHHGDLYTRLYDFDIAGDDPVFFDYSYADQRHRSNPVIQLPSPQWVRQPKIPGTVTDRISIEKHGRGAVHRTLRVEGRHHGRTGYWHKDITAARWSFTPTGDRLVGRVLDNPARDTSALGLAPSSDRRYSGRDPRLQRLLHAGAGAGPPGHGRGVLAGPAHDRQHPAAHPRPRPRPEPADAERDPRGATRRAPLEQPPRTAIPVAPRRSSLRARDPRRDTRDAVVPAPGLAPAPPAGPVVRPRSCRPGRAGRCGRGEQSRASCPARWSRWSSRRGS